MDIRERILDAATRVYAQHGFRGATTRSIAVEAGVNEVTLFRLFGSKAALVDALLQSHTTQSLAPLLPEDAAEPERDVTRWSTAVLIHMRDNRSLIRTTIGEAEERPTAAVCMCEGPSASARLLTEYAARLRAAGRTDPNADIPAAVTMLMSSLFADAVCRDIMPHLFPEPRDDAPTRYVRNFLRSLGVRVGTNPRARTRAAH